MRITSIRVGPVARIVAIIYGVLGILYVPTVLLTGAKEMTLPVGIVAPLLYLNLNLHLPVPSHFLSGVLSALAACVCYTLSGWLTGAAAVLAFNIVARRMGGIDASVIVSKLSTADNSAIPST
jgi:hypothetical protein